MNFLQVLNGGDEGNPHITAVENQCSSCAHWDKNTPTVCTAFPKGIPLVILLGIFDHTHPYDVEGVDDGGILYEPKVDVVRKEGPLDEARDKDGKWTGGESPVKRIGYREFKPLKAERFFVSEDDFGAASRILRAERRAHPGQKQWIVFSLGSSWHDPQAMGKIVSGTKVPDGVKPISTALDLRAAFRHMVAEEREAFGRSRNAD